MFSSFDNSRYPILLLLIPIVFWTLIVLAIILFIIIKGSANFSFTFLFSFPSSDLKHFGIFPSIIGSFLMTLISLSIFVPLGIFAGYYLSETKSRTFKKIALDLFYIFASIPTVIYGLFGLSFFVLHFGKNIDEILFSGIVFGQPIMLWASVVLGMISLPMIVVYSYEIFQKANAERKELVLSLGGDEVDVFFRAILPEKSREIFGVIILSFARILGETAPILFLGAAFYLPNIPITKVDLFLFELPLINPFDQFMHLGYQIFALSTQAANQETFESLAFGISSFLLIAVFIINFISYALYFKIISKLNEKS